MPTKKLSQEQIEAIRATRFDNTITQREKAEKLGVTQSLINYYSNGRRKEEEYKSGYFDPNKFAKHFPF